MSLQRLLDHLDRAPAAGVVLVTVDRTQGSVPREEGTWMAVLADAVIGTIGGGRLEFDAIAHARELLAGAAGAQPPAQRRYPLGPTLGQCCGGVVWLGFRHVPASDPSALREQLTRDLMQRHAPVALFGGGHVGTALVRALAPLPFAVTWIDSRDEIFPPDAPANVRCEHSDPVHAAVAELPAGSRVLIMSFSHAEDLDIVATCLRRQRERADLAFIGLIGSRTKWATFRHRLSDRGFSDAELSRVTCPIGVKGVQGKEPEVIAVAVAAQLLQLPRS